ncbi:DivIVA domain-containing protein [bacterium]|nr:DivIVA domain-containing protein [bacterium]
MAQGNWTPEEIKAQNFRGSAFGYARKEVQEFLNEISKLTAQLTAENTNLSRRVLDLEKELHQWRLREQEMSETRARIVEEAQATREKARTEAEHLMSETENKADEIRQRTENWLEEVIARVEETQRQKRNFMTAFRSALDSHYELLNTEDSQEQPLTAGLTDVLRSTPPPRN